MGKRKNIKKKTKKRTTRTGMNKLGSFGPFGLLRAHGNKKSQKVKQIIDIPFSEYKSKGTKASLGNMGFNYQSYGNIALFFHNVKDNFTKDLNYTNPEISLISRKNKIDIEYVNKFNYDKKFNILIINLNTEEGNHANIALINNKNSTIEYFEPHGYRKNKNSEIAGNKGIYHKKLKLLRKLFGEILPTHSFIDVVSTNKKTSFQTELDPDEHSGFCVLWCVLFVHYRLLNQDVLLSRLIKHIDKIMNTTKLLKYARYVEDTIKLKI